MIAATLSLVALAVLGAGIALSAARLVVGPSMFDRVLAFDCLTLHVVGALLVVSVHLRTADFLDAVLVLALLGFLGTMSLAAFLEGTLVD